MQVDSANYLIYSGWKNSGAEIKDIKMPSTLMKAVKNGTELCNARNALLRDSCAVTRFMRWLKTKAEEAGKRMPGGTLMNDDGTAVTEITADEVLFIDRGFQG